jgi:hypothetical protein
VGHVDSKRGEGEISDGTRDNRMEISINKRQVVQNRIL